MTLDEMMASLSNSETADAIYLLDARTGWLAGNISAMLSPEDLERFRSDRISRDRLTVCRILASQGLTARELNFRRS